MNSGRDARYRQGDMVAFDSTTDLSEVGDTTRVMNTRKNIEIITLTQDDNGSGSPDPSDAPARVGDMVVTGGGTYRFTGNGIIGVAKTSVSNPEDAFGQLYIDSDSMAVFANDANNFDRGIVLNNGRLAFSDASQLGTLFTGDPFHNGQDTSSGIIIAGQDAYGELVANADDMTLGIVVNMQETGSQFIVNTDGIVDTGNITWDADQYSRNNTLTITHAAVDGRSELGQNVNGIYGKGALVKTGNGTLILADANSYQGGTIVQGGTLAVAADDRLGKAQTGVLLDAGTFRAMETFTTDRNVYLMKMRDDGAGGRIGGGTIEVDQDTILTVDGLVTDQPDGSSGVPPRALGDAGEFRKDGDGTLVLTNTANDYDGDTYVDRGTLVAVGLGTLGPNVAGKVLVTQTNSGASSRLEFRIDGDETLRQTLIGNGEVIKSGSGVLNLVDDSDFSGLLTVQSGRLHLTADYGRTDAFRIESGGILTGTGILGGNGPVGGVVASGGVVAPGGVTANDPLVNPTASPLTISGSLTFLAGSLYQVVLTQYRDAGYDPANPERMRPVSDTIAVRDGKVTIQDGAVLGITFDYWSDNLSQKDFNGETSGVFTIIDAESNTTIADRDVLFRFDGVNLPNGVELLQGWNNNLYQVWFRGTPMARMLPFISHNQMAVNNAVNNGGPGLEPILSILSDNSIPLAEITDIYNQVAGDIRANSLGMALKKPWRQPFERLNRDIRGQVGASIVDGGFMPPSGVWAELYGRRTDMRSDGNAYNHDIDRAGVVVGYQRAFSPQMVLGAALNGSIVDLKQRTGHVDMDDLELGVYGLARVDGWFDVSGYFGIGRQVYDVTRRVNIPAHGGAEPIHERFDNSVNGHSLAASIELSRDFALNRFLTVSPVAAFEYEHVWQKSYRESRGVTALHFARADMAYTALRAGVNIGIALSERVDLNGRLHYSRRIGEDCPKSEQRFASATTAQASEIWGVKSGRDTVTIGLSAAFALDRRGRTFLTVAYDGDFSRRGTSHTGNFGITHAW